MRRAQRKGTLEREKTLERKKTRNRRRSLDHDEGPIEFKPLGGIKSTKPALLVADLVKSDLKRIAEDANNEDFCNRS